MVTDRTVFNRTNDYGEMKERRDPIATYAEVNILLLMTSVTTINLLDMVLNQTRHNKKRLMMLFTRKMMYLPLQ